MKIIFNYKVYNGVIDHPDANILDAERYNIFYSKYFANTVRFLELLESVNYFLDNIKAVENGEKEVFESQIIIPDIYIYIYKDVVKFEQNQGYWEDWECPTIELKKALIAWKKFLELPKDPYRRMIVKINNL